MKAVRTGIFIQARSASTRLPGKIFEGLPVPGKLSVLEHIYKRLSKVQEVSSLLILIPENDTRLREFCSIKNLPFLEGPEDDVRERYRLAAWHTKCDIIVRATADNPCVDPKIAEETVKGILRTGADLFSFSNLPLGAAVEAFTREALSDETRSDSGTFREHVSLHIKHNPSFFKVVHQDHDVMEPWCGKPDTCRTQDLPRLTVDTPEDLITVRKVFERLGDSFDTADVMRLWEREPELFETNRMIRQITFPSPAR